MIRCYLGLGSNQNNPKQQLSQAIKHVRTITDTYFIDHASFYLSKPVDDSDQALFFNTVVAIDTHLSAKELLNACLAIEKKQHRIRGSRWGPRTLDIDVLLYGNKYINEPYLTIPHNEMRNRDFVLIPLYEIAPSLILPDKIPLKSIYQQAPQNIIQCLDVSQ